MKMVNGHVNTKSELKALLNCLKDCFPLKNVLIRNV